MAAIVLTDVAPTVSGYDPVPDWKADPPADALYCLHVVVEVTTGATTSPYDGTLALRAVNSSGTSTDLNIPMATMTTGSKFRGYMVTDLQDESALSYQFATGNAAVRLTVTIRPGEMDL